jgi:hypothetical protein
MPTFEVSCSSTECREFGKVKDTILRSWKEPNPTCPVCRSATQRVMATPPKSIWLGSVGRFSDPTKENYDPDGFTAYRVKSTRNIDGSPEAVRIETRRQMIDFAKAEGLRMPDEMSSNAQISRNGKTFSTCGLPGQWSGLPSRMVTDSEGEHDSGWI